MPASLSEQDYLIIGTTFLFRNCDRMLVCRAAQDARCDRRSAQAGETVYTPSSYMRSLGIVLSGRLEARRATGGARGFVTSILEEGDLFGAAALFNEQEDYVTTLTAIRPCDCLLLPEALVSDLFREEPRLAENYIRYLSERIRFLSAKLDEVSADGAARKLSRFLLSLGDAETVRLPCALGDLPQRLGISRASLYRAFDTLEALGVLQREGKLIRILDAEKLHTI